MNKAIQLETTKETHTILMLLGKVEAFESAHSEELASLITDQSIDDSGRARGEYLGGNGVAQWSHCKGHIIENSGFESGSDATYQERSILDQAVKEHQTSIEANGCYNVRQLAHWKGGFNGETFLKSETRHAKERADHGYKIDKRKSITASELSNKALKASMTNAQWQKHMRTQRKLAKQA